MLQILSDFTSSILFAQNFKHKQDINTLKFFFLKIKAVPTLSKYKQIW